MSDLTLEHTTHVRIQKPANEIENELIKLLTAEERRNALIYAGTLKRAALTAAKDKGDHALDAGKQFVFFSYLEMISDNLPPHQIERVLHRHIKEAKLAIKKRQDILYNQGILTAAIDHLKNLAAYEAELADMEDPKHAMGGKWRELTGIPELDEGPEADEPDKERSDTSTQDEWDELARTEIWNDALAGRPTGENY